MGDLKTRSELYLEASGESKPQARLLLFFKHNTI